MANDSIETALELFASTGPEFGGGLSNHGPMAAEALVSLGRGEAVEEWSAWYARKLTEPPESRNAIDAASWREALGDIGRAGDWAVFFRRELDERPWREAVIAWLPRLAPGIMAGATHGILRTAHAVRSLERGETPARRTELADGLAYWAARYQTLPTAAGAGGVLDVPDALRLVPRVPDGGARGGLIFERVRAVADTEFATAVNHVSLDAALDRFISDVTRAFVRWYLANADLAAIAFVHTVTAPSALRILAPYVPSAHARDVMRYAWQACAAVYAVYGRNAPADQPPPGAFDAEDLIDRAVRARDEHAIKFTEACLREHRLTGDRVFLAAAADAVSRLRA